jgi:hypothetical protein
MRFLARFVAVAASFALVTEVSAHTGRHVDVEAIVLNAKTGTSRSTNVGKNIGLTTADGIDLESLPFTASALSAIQTVSNRSDATLPDFSNASRIDVHGTFRHKA